MLGFKIIHVSKNVDKTGNTSPFENKNQTTLNIVVNGVRQMLDFNSDSQYQRSYVLSLWWTLKKIIAGCTVSWHVRMTQWQHFRFSMYIVYTIRCTQGVIWYFDPD